MESLGYVRHTPDLADERITRVFLLEEGWAVICQIDTSFNQIDEVLLSCLNASEQEVLVGPLRKVYNGLASELDNGSANGF
jgi:DNA-binding MarR family transcriptional regulator